jgi:hypothetical protein
MLMASQPHLTVDQRRDIAANPAMSAFACHMDPAGAPEGGALGGHIAIGRQTGALQP